MVMSNTFSLKLRLFLATTLLVAIVLGLVILISSFFKYWKSIHLRFLCHHTGFCAVHDWAEDGGKNNARELRVRAGSTEFTCNG